MYVVLEAIGKKKIYLRVELLPIGLNYVTERKQGEKRKF